MLDIDKIYGGRAWVILGCAALCVMLSLVACSMLGWRHGAEMRLVVVNGGDGDLPAVALASANPEDFGLMVFCVGGKRASMALSDALRRRGIDGPAVVFMTNATASVKNAERLADRLSISRLVCFEYVAKRGKWDHLAKLVAAEGGGVLAADAKANVNDWTVTHHDESQLFELVASRRDFRMVVKTLRSGEMEISWKKGDAAEEVIHVAPSNRESAKVYDLP